MTTPYLRSYGLWVYLLVLASATCLAGCDLPIADEKVDTPHVTDLEDQVREVFKRLFPELSERELDDLSGALSMSEVLALRAELEKIRKAAAEFSRELFKSAEERASERKEALEPYNDGFPSGLAALGQICTYDSKNKRGQVTLSGVFNGKEQVVLESSQVQLKIDGSSPPFSFHCVSGGPTVDIVFLIDITGSMSNVIDSVRDSVVSFVDRIEASGVRGTLSVVTFQDSVGVNRTFQEPAPSKDYERSPFFAPVSLNEAKNVEALRAFVNRLEANRGADAPENLAGAIDFARNSVIGYTATGAANVIGDGKEDPAGTEPFPALTSDRQVLVVLTDITFHGDDRTPDNSSLLAPFVPRNARDILASLHQTGTTIHVSDPSWVDSDTDPESKSVDADYWAIHTGGLGEDIVEGYSLVDLELVVVAEKSGLLDITLDRIIGSTCTLDFDATLSANAKVEVELNVGDAQLTTTLQVHAY